MIVSYMPDRLSGSVPFAIVRRAMCFDSGAGPRSGRLMAVGSLRRSAEASRSVGEDQASVVFHGALPVHSLSSWKAHPI